MSLPVQSLRAGPVEVLYTSGELRHLRVHGVEVVERIYAAVRGPDWSTIAMRVEQAAVEENDAGFRVTFRAVHQQGAVDFRWYGSIGGAADGTVVFSMDGRAHSAFARNRIGLCVHHPLRFCAGRPCNIETAPGVWAAAQFPEFVAPHQPFRNLRAISQTVTPGLTATIRFAGDVFETEDHRNWTDANFKTYGTPLDAPFPVEVNVGDAVRQSVTVAFEGKPAAMQRRAPAGLRVCVGGATGRPLPAVGLGMGRALRSAELAALRALRLSHLRANALDPRALDAARELGTRLEAVVAMPCDLHRLAGMAPWVERWLVHGPADDARRLRDVVGSGAVIATGTAGNFAELNRQRPDGDGWDAACFAVNPQVHAFDDDSVMANAAAQAEVVRSAHRFLGGRAVAISPAVLLPAPGADPRQQTAFCAAWTVASLKALTQAGVASVTYFETAGPAGVVDGERRYPVYRVFEALAQWPAAEVLECAASAPSRVAALAFQARASRCLLIANTRDSECTVDVDGPDVELRLAPYEVEVVTWT